MLFSFAGILQTASGYSACFIRVDEKTVRLHDRLTVEALRCLLEQTGFTEPLFVSESVTTCGSSGGSGNGIKEMSNRGGGNGVMFPFLSRDQSVEVERIKGYGVYNQGIILQRQSHAESTFHQQVLRRVASYLDIELKEFRYTCHDTYVDTDSGTETEELLAEGGEERTPTQARIQSETETQRWQSGRRRHRPLPVYTSTALQIGLLNNPNVPK